MNIRSLSGALILVTGVTLPGFAQRSRPAPPAPEPIPAAIAAPSPAALPDVVSVPAPEVAPAAVAAPAATAVPAAIAAAAPAPMVAPVLAVLPPVAAQEPAGAPAPEDAPSPVVAPDDPPRAGPTPAPGAPRSPRPARAAMPRAGQGPPPMGASAPVATPRPPVAREYVEDAGMKNQIFEVRHRDPARLMEVLMALGSGRPGAVIDASREFKTLSVRDFPENIATIEGAIKRLDVPAPPSSDIDLRLFVLLASPAADGAIGELPSEIRGAAQQLQSAFGYKGFRLLAPIMQRSREGHAQTAGAGEISGANAGISDQSAVLRYNYQIRSITQTKEPGGSNSIDLSGFIFDMSGRLGNARIGSDLSLKPGEQVVVGSASLNRTALILILSATVVK